jgi:hypothetical protein
VKQRSPNNPALSAGAVLFVIAGLADLGHHVLPDSIGQGVDHLVGDGAVNAHVLLVTAMGLVLLGLVQHGLRHRRTMTNAQSDHSTY